MPAVLLETQSPIDDIDEKLERWGAYERWFRRKQTCGSIEKGWRSPQRWDAPPISSPSKANIQEAQEIRDAITLVQLDHALLMTAWYVDNARPDKLLTLTRLCGFRRPTMNDVNIALDSGRAQLSRALLIPAVVRKLRVRNRIKKALQDGVDVGLSFA